MRERKERFGERRDWREGGSASRGRGREDWGVSKESGGVRREREELVEESGTGGKGARIGAARGR